MAAALQTAASKPSYQQKPAWALEAEPAQAERGGWLGEVEGRQTTLAGAEDKLTQIDRRPRTTIDLGLPAIGNATR